jgi:hypothetical protein
MFLDIALKMIILLEHCNNFQIILRLALGEVIMLIFTGFIYIILHFRQVSIFKFLVKSYL